MPLLQTTTLAHLAGSLVLALFFILLLRHDPRPYLRAWTAAWSAQVLSLAALLLPAGGYALGDRLFLLFGGAHALLIVGAAQNYARGEGPSRSHAFVAGVLVLWSLGAPWVLQQEGSVLAAQLAVLAAAYLLAARVLWPLREPAGMGLRLTTNVLTLLGLVATQHAVAFAWTAREEARPAAYLEAAPFTLLLLQMLLALGMVLAVMEAAQWALSATNQQLLEAQRRLRVAAETDPLTGCFNRHVFRELVDDVRAQSADAEGVVIMLDMDGLKAINDRQGHSAGDQAIRGVADAIRTRTRTTDVLVRWGGDEFVVVIPGASAAEGEGRRAEIVAAIAAAGLSASAGLACYGPTHDIVEAVRAADRIMYRVKAEKKGVAPPA